MQFEWNEMTKLILKILFLLCIGFVASKGIKKLLNQIFRLNRKHEAITNENEQVTITILKHTISMIQYVTWVVIFLSIGGLLEMTAFVQVIAGLGVVIGYVARDFVNDFIMGMVILLEQQFHVGDIVTINDKTGTVQEIGLRTTTLILTENDGRCIISNRLITSAVVQSGVVKQQRKKGGRKRNVKK